GVDAPALPGDGDVARPLGKPHGAEREQRDDGEINEDADHCGVGVGWDSGETDLDLTHELSYQSVSPPSSPRKRGPIFQRPVIMGSQHKRVYARLPTRYARERQQSRGYALTSLAEPRERIGGEAAARVDRGDARLRALDPGLGRRARVGRKLSQL